MESDNSIELLLKNAKDNFEIQTALKKDLTKRNLNSYEIWENIYQQQPSCKLIEDGHAYQNAMREKYIRVYKLCLERIIK